MKHKFFFSTLTLLALCTGGFANSTPKNEIGIVNFATCMSDSKLGKQEQTAFENLKTQMNTLVQNTEKQLAELTTKFQDAEYMDGLSPEAEEDMKMKYKNLSEEMARYQNQYYQVLNQANMKIFHTVGASIQEAAAKVATDHNLNMVLNQEACFFNKSTFDVTPFVITEMNKNFDQKAGKLAAPAAPAAQPQQAKKDPKAK